jgi:hypothetical protein
MTIDNQQKRANEAGVRPRIAIINFEKRKYPRFTVDLPLEYSRVPHPEGGPPEPGRVVNASEGGLLIYFPEEVNVGECLRIKLFFTLFSLLNTIEMTVEVAWVDIHPCKEWGDYRCGVKFLEVRPEDLSRLKSFLMSLSQ